jgi:hypothetical protein
MHNMTTIIAHVDLGKTWTETYWCLQQVVPLLEGCNADLERPSLCGLKRETPEKMIEHSRKKEEESVSAAVHGLKDGEDNNEAI